MSTVFLLQFLFSTTGLINKQITGPLKCFCLSEENVVSGLYLDQDLGEKLVGEEPALWNICFFLSQKRNDQNS
jgi:hypothetical protein